MSEKATPEDRAWDDWFDKQFDLCRQIDRAIAGLTVGADDMLRAALWSSVIEHGAEALRTYIPLVPTRVAPPEVTPCPECQQGKHQNCTVEMLVGETFVGCPCRDAVHA